MSVAGGRPQAPLDPTSGPLACFAADLRALREAAGSPTYRVMAARTGLPAASLARTASGQVLPGVRLVRGYVAACGGDELTWIARWRALATAEHTRRRTGGRAARTPG